MLYMTEFTEHQIAFMAATSFLVKKHWHRRKLKRVLKTDTVEFCSYRVRDQLFVSKMEIQEPGQVSIVEWNITGMTAD